MNLPDTSFEAQAAGAFIVPLEHPKPTVDPAAAILRGLLVDATRCRSWRAFAALKRRLRGLADRFEWPAERFDRELDGLLVAADRGGPLA